MVRPSDPTRSGIGFIDLDIRPYIQFYDITVETIEYQFNEQ